MKDKQNVISDNFFIRVCSVSDCKITFFLVLLAHDLIRPLQVMRIYLIGYMGAGKTRTGRELAALMGWSFLDLDTQFENRYKVSVNDFFQTYSEEQFRIIESRLLRETSLLQQTVISTGGGTPCFHGNMEWIRKHGISLYLRWDVEVLSGRLLKIRKQRPVLRDLSPGQLPGFVRDHLAERGKWYLQADIIYDAESQSLEALTEKIRQRIEGNRV